MTPREQIRQVQQAVLDRGGSVGNSGADGIWGNDTFDGVMDMLARIPETARAAGCPWLTEARGYLGMQEGTARANKALNLDSAAIPWCGAFVGMVMASSLPTERLPKNQLWARDWLNFGHDPGSVYQGNVAVFARGSGGHVGFVVGHEKSYLHILGGNQSNRVSISKIAKSRLLGYRWPRGYEIPSAELPHTTISATVTTNEV